MLNTPCNGLHMLGSFCSLGFLQLLLNCDKRLPCIVSCSEFVDHMAGGNTIQRLSKIPEFEVTMPNQADRLMMTAEVCDSFSTTCFLDAVVLCQAGSPLCVALAMPYIIIKQHAVMTKAAMTKTFRTQDLACPHMTAAPRPYTCPWDQRTWQITTWCCLQSYQENMAVNLTELGPQIPAETHMYWYTAETGVSLLHTL